MKIRLFSLCAALAAPALASPRVCGDTVILNPGDSIAEAIGPRREILLNPGTYFTPEILISADDVVLRGIEGADVTEIVMIPSLPNSVLLNTTGWNVVIEDVTLRAPNESGGPDFFQSAVRCGAGKCSFRDVVFTDAARGAEVFATQFQSFAFAEFDRCVFRGFDAPQDGAGVYVDEGGTAVFRGCRFEENRCGRYGGGIFVRSGDVSVIGCGFEENQADDSGGAIAAREGATLGIIDSTFIGNIASIWGGGVLGEDSTVTIYRSSFLQNQAGDTGGAVRLLSFRILDLAGSVIESCVFEQNVSASATAVDWDDASAVFQNNIVIESPLADQAALRLSRSVQRGSLLQSRITHNTLYASDAAGTGVVFDRGIGVFANNIVSGFGASVVRKRGDYDIRANVLSDLPLDLAPMNFGFDPRFVDADSGDVRLLAVSPAIDSGDDGFLGRDQIDLDSDLDRFEHVPFDRDGSPRVLDGDGDGIARVDLGAIEFVLAAFEGCPADITRADAPTPAFDGFGEPDGLLTPADFAAFAYIYGASCP